MGECKYCRNLPQISDDVLLIQNMEGGRLYLLKDQTLRGRCIVASLRHEKHAEELSMEEFLAVQRDVFRVIQGLKRAYRPDQINCLILGDAADHLHIHIVPKYRGEADWGSVFQVDREDKTLLSQQQYQEEMDRIRTCISDFENQNAQNAGGLYE